MNNVIISQRKKIGSTKLASKFDFQEHFSRAFYPQAKSLNLMSLLVMQQSVFLQNPNSCPNIALASLAQVGSKASRKYNAYFYQEHGTSDSSSCNSLSCIFGCADILLLPPRFCSTSFYHDKDNSILSLGRISWVILRLRQTKLSTK